MGVVAEDFVKHLEFLGHEIEPDEEEEDALLAKHQTRGTTTVRSYLDGILLQQYFRIKDDAKNRRLEFLEAVNKLNATARVTTYVGIGEERTLLRMDGCYLGPYDKKKFGLFLDAYVSDTNDRVVRDEAMKQFIG